jgi:hypothetical protein
MRLPRRVGVSHEFGARPHPLLSTAEADAFAEYSGCTDFAGCAGTGVDDG